MSKAVYLALGLVFAGCGEEQVEQVTAPRPVKILELGSGNVTGALELPGSVSAAQSAEMAFEVSGQIVSFPVRQGEIVARGAILASLDAADYEANRDAELAQRNAARADYERYKELYSSDAVSLQNLEVARRNYDVAEASYRTADKALRDTRLRAPFGGRVARKLVDEFVTVQARQPVLVLQDDSDLEVIVNVPEGTLASSQAEGLEIQTQVEVSAYPGQRFAARLKEFATAADPVTRTFEATFAFEVPSDVAVLPGMTARVIATITDTSAEAGFQIPASAVLSGNGGQPAVWRIDPATMDVHRAAVELGDLSGSTVVVEGGVSAGDLIAVSGVHNLREGMTVRPYDE